MKKSDALPLLRIIWEDIVKLPKSSMDKILRGPPDWIKSGAAGRVVQTIQLKELIFYHLDKLEKDTEMIMTGTELKDLVL